MNSVVLRRSLVYWLMRCGLPGGIGLVLIAAAAVYALLVLVPANARSHQLSGQIAAAMIRYQHDQRGEPGALSPVEQLQAFYRAFPKETTIPDWLGKIYALAAAQNLDLELGEYSLNQEKFAHLDQFRIVFPVKGSYPQIRRFIGAALATAPALALDSLSLKRDKVGDATVDARIVFLLFLEKST